MTPTNCVRRHKSGGEERDHVIAFVRGSERGIIKGMLDEPD